MIFQSFKTLLGNGRAWRLVNANISALVYALIKPFEDIRRSAYRIVYAPFLTSNTYATEDEQLTDVENYEDLFGIEVISDILKERQANAEVQWSLRGGQGFGYIEQVMARAGLQVKVVENIPMKDLTYLGTFEYGHTQYGQTVNDTKVQYGASGYKLICNGTLYYGNDYDDPAKITRWDKVLIITVINPMTYGQYKIFMDLLLKVRPAEYVCLCKITLY